MNTGRLQAWPMMAVFSPSLFDPAMKSFDSES